jgi:hypothetical protein
MATQPITCPYDVDSGFRLNRGDLILDDGKTMNPPVYMVLKDLSLELNNFSKGSFNLSPGGSFTLSQSDVADSNGFVTFLAIKAIFPPSTVESKKYLLWEHKGQTYNLGELMILSGGPYSTSDSELIGWNLSNPGNVFPEGGITFLNPHANIPIKLEFLVAC